MPEVRLLHYLTTQLSIFEEMKNFCNPGLLFFHAVFLALLNLTTAASTGGRSPAFMHPFYIFSEPSHRSLYAIRLDLHLYRDLGLREYHTIVLDHPPLREQELEFELRYDKAAQNILHLGPSEDHERGIAVAFPIGGEAINPSSKTFALLTLHPPAEGQQLRDNFASIIIRGYARVIDHEHNDIEGAIRRVRVPSNAQVMAGQALSIRRLFREIEGHHPLLL